MTYCGEYTYVKTRPDAIEATTLLCRSWTCDHCREDRKRQLIAQAHRGRANTFITITCRRDRYETPNEAAQALAQAWRIIAKRAVRLAHRNDRAPAERSSTRIPLEQSTDNSPHPGPPVKLPNGRLEYLVVIEAHASGWPHLHILCRSIWIGQKWLSEQLNELLGSPVCYIQRVTKRAAVSAYVAKYCGKCVHKFGTTKRYWQTQGYQVVKWERDEQPRTLWHDCSRVPDDISKIAHNLEVMHWCVTFERRWHLTASPPCPA